MTLTKKTKAIILTGLLTCSLGTLSGCGSKEVSQPKTETTAKAQSEEKLVVHGADVVKSHLLQFLQMDREESLSFAKKNISNKIVLEERSKKLGDQSKITLESNHNGMDIKVWHLIGDDVVVSHTKVIFGKLDFDYEKSLEKAQLLLSEYGVSPNWEQNKNEKSRVATKEIDGSSDFISKVGDTTVNVHLVTELKGKTQVIKEIYVQIKK